MLFCHKMTAKSNINQPYINTNGNLKKRVLFVVTQSEMGGAQRFTLNLVSNLNQDKYEILIAIGNTGNGDLFRALHAISIPTHRLNRLTRDMDIKQDLGAISELRKLIKEFRPDIVFLNSSKAGFIGSLAAIFPFKIRGVKIIYRIGGWTFNDPWPLWKKWFFIVLEWLSARWKDVIIVNNQHDLDQAKKLWIKPRKELTLVYNGIETYKLNLLNRDEARIKLFEKAVGSSGRIFQTEFIVGTIANFYPAKGLEYLIRTAYYSQDNDNLVFFIIGDGQERPDLEMLIKELGLERKIFLVGQIPDAFRYLSAFDMFVLPSVKEGFPWTLIEAMAAKLPIVATRVGAVPEIIDDYKNGIIVEPGNPQAIAEKIKEIAGSNRLQKELGIQAHQTVLFKFGLDKMVEQIEELL